MAPADDDTSPDHAAKGDRLDGLWVGGGGSPRLKSRALCCAGVAVLLQNLLVLQWRSSSMLDCEVEPESPSPHLVFPTASTTSVVQKRLRAHKKKKKKKKKSAGHTRTTSSTTMKPSTVPAVLPGGPIPTATLERLNTESTLFSVPRERLRLFGTSPPNTVRIAVGFGSVKRKKDYVLTTVAMMLGMDGKTQVSEAEKQMVVVIAHLADWDMEWVNSVSDKLQADNAGLVSKGLFHGIHAPEEIYPELMVCPPLCTYGDEPIRVKWRSKQNIDYAFLMYYAITLAPYYIQIEDDLGVANNWIQKMHNYVTTGPYGPTFRGKCNEPWRMIDFSELGFIGKMFQSNELIRMAQFLLLFYDQMPCDLLVNDWLQAMNQRKRIDYWKKSASLFQHVGVFRTLGGFQTLQERRFGKLLFDNPASSSTWNLTIVPTYEAKFAYFPGGEPRSRNDKCDFTKSKAHEKQKRHRCWFWASQVPKNSQLTLQFSAYGGIPMKAVFVEFGHAKHPEDLLQQGEIQVAGAGTGLASGKCGDFHHLVTVTKDEKVYWEEGSSDPKELPVPKVQCLRILATEAQTGWMAIQTILVRSTG